MKQGQDIQASISFFQCQCRTATRKPTYRCWRASAATIFGRDVVPDVGNSSATSPGLTGSSDGATSLVSREREKAGLCVSPRSIARGHGRRERVPHGAPASRTQPA